MRQQGWYLKLYNDTNGQKILSARSVKRVALPPPAIAVNPGGSRKPVPANAVGKTPPIPDPENEEDGEIDVRQCQRWEKAEAAPG